MLIENCHQGAYTPGMRQWQGYVKNTSSGGYEHYLGMFFGMGSALSFGSVSLTECRARCDSLNTSCGGFTFTSDSPTPTSKIQCLYKAKVQENHMDMSNSNYCTGNKSPSDCPFHLYRVSGDISRSWRSVLANLAYTLPFLGEGGLHPPYPSADGIVRSRPGGWAYPDMCVQTASLWPPRLMACAHGSCLPAYRSMSSPGCMRRC